MSGQEPVDFADRMAIATPEGVEVELTLAGIGSRFIAGAIDFAIQAVVGGSLALILQPAGSTGVAILTSAWFAVVFFYDVLFEVLGGGRTPGKRATGLRVVRSGGRPITLVRSAIRNILRLIDILPALYAVGMTSIFITRHNQRIGDLAAGTHVVRVRLGDRHPPAALVETHGAGEAATWDVSAVSTDDVATVRAFLDRRADLTRESRAAIGSELARRLRPLVGGAPEDLSDERFLALLVATKTTRRRPAPRDTAP
jgi:uncharacterized RDD family membrane protein YckC